MKRFQRILLFAGTRDGGEAALREAAGLAASNEAKLVLFDVVKPVPAALMLFDSASEAREFERELADERRDELTRFGESHLPSGIDWGVDVAVGRPGVACVRAVLRDGYDLVVKTADGGGVLRQCLFGSVGRYLIRNCPCPVWIIRPNPHGGFARILAAVDTDSTDALGEELNDRIVELASSLAERQGAELHVVHAWHLWMERALRGRARFRPNEIDALVREQEQKAAAAVARLLQRNNVPAETARVHIVKGEPETVVPEVVEELHADLLVMGTVCRVGVAGFVIGNTAERILNDVDSSVLTVKPQGFECPVLPER